MWRLPYRWQILIHMPSTRCLQAWTGPKTALARTRHPPRLPRHGGTWQVEALLLPRALWGRVQGGRRRGAGREGRCWRGGRGGRRGRGIAAGVWLVRDRDVVLQKESRAGGRGQRRSSERELSGKRLHSGILSPPFLSPQILPKSCLLRHPHQVASSCGRNSVWSQIPIHGLDPSVKGYHVMKAM